MSPKGRIDILQDQEQQRENSTKDLIFKNSGPLKPVIAGGNAYVAGDQLCEVEISTSYHQAADRVVVEALIDNSQCAASNGKYKVKVRTRNADGETETQTHQEVWSRLDAKPVEVQHSYQLNDDVELIKARIQMPTKDYCTCIDSN